VINTINLWTGLPRIQEPPEIFTSDPVEKLERLVERLP
jgi:hypothetical protein